MLKPLQDATYIQSAKSICIKWQNPYVGRPRSFHVTVHVIVANLVKGPFLNGSHRLLKGG